MAQFASDWKTATLDFDRSDLEFTGDDVDRYTDVVDLGEGYEHLTVFVPALSASAKVTPYIQRDAKIDTVTPANGTVPVAMVTMDGNATGHFAQATSSGAGGFVAIFRIGGARFVRLYTDANQSANRLFTVKGFNRQVTV